MPDHDGSEKSAQDLDAELQQLAQRAGMLKLIATSANIVPHTIAAFDCREAGKEIGMVATAIDLALDADSADAIQLEQFAKALQRIATTLETALYMGGFNAPNERSVVEWRAILNAIMAS